MLTETVYGSRIMPVYQHEGWRRLPMSGRQTELWEMVDHVSKWFKSPVWRCHVAYAREPYENGTYSEVAFLFSPDKWPARWQDIAVQLLPLRDRRNPRHVFKVPQDEVVDGVQHFPDYHQISFHPKTFGLFESSWGDNERLVDMYHVDEEWASAVEQLSWPYLVNTVELAPLRLAEVGKVLDSEGRLSDYSKTFQDDRQVAVRAYIFNIKSAVKERLRELGNIKPSMRTSSDNTAELLQNVLHRFDRFQDFCYANP